MKLGIVGTGRIAKRFVPEARTVKGIEIETVCNPHRESAKQFAEEMGILNYTNRIEELVEQVDAVYVATPHETHYDYTKAMLMRGKHVLCEKPMVFSRQQAEELFNLAKEHNCILMEGIKTAYCPGFQALIEVVGKGKIGRIRDVEACFSRLTSSDMREMKDARYGGSFTEFGTYTLLPIMKLLGMNEVKTDFWMIPEENGIDGYAKVSVDYGETIGLSKTGLTIKSEGQLIIAGSEGYIVVQAPWWLTRHFDIHREDPNQREDFDFPYEGQGLRYEIKAFVDKISGIGNNEIGVSPSESIWLADKMESFLKYRETIKIFGKKPI